LKKFLFFIMLFLLCCFKVSAESVTLVQEKFDDVYVYYYDSSQGKTRFLEAEKMVLGDRVGYCIEIGKKITSSIYQITTSFDGININPDDLEYIKLASYYGYDYPGHNTDNYYMATQELIWVRLIRTSIKWTIDFDTTVFKDLSKEKNEITRLIVNHKIKPSFDDSEIEIVKGREYVFEDTNNVLSLYRSTSDDVVIDGNKLIIKDSFDDDEILLEKISGNKRDFFIYTSGNSQKLMSSGTVDDVISKIKVNLINGSIKINKLDKDTLSDVSSGEASLNGAVYELYDMDNNFIDTLIVGEKEKISNLGLGKYYIKEKEAGTGYLLDNNIYEFEITKDNLDIELNLYNNVIKRQIDIFKVFASSETGILVGESDIIFEIYDKNNNLVGSITTDSEGYASIILPYGTYTFKQINSTENYYKVQDFSVTVDNYSEKPIYKLLSDSEITAKVKVIKKDYDTKDNIIDGNAKFRIFDIEKNEFVTFKLLYPEEKTIDEFVINTDGTFVTPFELSSGKYILYEVDDYLDGYLYNKEGIPFEIGDNSNLINIDENVILEIPFYNKRVKGSIIINKYGEDILFKDNMYYYKDIMLENVLFEVYAGSDIYENGKLIYSKDELVKEIITDSSGVGIIDHLPLGRYYIKEIKSSNNNVISDEIYEVELKYKDQYTENIEYNLDVYNYLNKGKLIINKYESGTKIGIGNTLVEIRNTDDDVVYKGYTDKNGKIILDDLLYGEYYLSEVEASTGYKLLDDKIYFNIDSDEFIIDIYNERLSIPNTGIDVSVYNLLAIVVILLSIFFIICFWENKKIVILCFVIIGVSILYIINYFYRSFTYEKVNEKVVDQILSNESISLDNEKYQYSSILEIPSIGLKRGILDIDNKYNDVKYNIEVIKNGNDSIVLASHNGNNYNSFFDDLDKMEIGDYINYYEDDKLYKYVYSESYEIKKNGYADIYTDNGKNSIVLITCKRNSNDAQVVYVGYLTLVSSYEMG